MLPPSNRKESWCEMAASILFCKHSCPKEKLLVLFSSPPMVCTKLSDAWKICWARIFSIQTRKAKFFLTPRFSVDYYFFHRARRTRSQRGGCRTDGDWYVMTVLVCRDRGATCDPPSYGSSSVMGPRCFPTCQVRGFFASASLSWLPTPQTRISQRLNLGMWA